MSPVLLLESESDPRSARERQAPVMDEFVQLKVHVAKLTSDVEHIKSDVADIKVDLRRINGELAGKIDSVEQRLTDKIDAVDEKLTRKIDAVEQKLTGKIDSLRTDFSSAKIWALGLYVGQAASLLFVMAKGFKWL